MTARIDPSSLPGRPCSLASALAAVGERWSMLVIREVMLGNHQFQQIARNTGAPTDRIAARLKDLVGVGVLERRRAAESDRYPGYYLTEAGVDLTAAARQLMQWGDDWAVNTPPPLRSRHHDHPMRLKQVCATCGEEIDPETVHREMAVPGWSIAGPEPLKTADR